jgi:hypothetical protein
MVVRITRESFYESNLLGREVKDRAFSEALCPFCWTNLEDIRELHRMRSQVGYVELRKFCGEVAGKLRKFCGRHAPCTINNAE